MVSLETSSAVGIEKQEDGKVVDFKMVTFILSGKEYGVEIMNVKEIQKGSRFTFVPNAPPYVRGVYNLRGEIIPVIDLRRFFGIPDKDQDQNTLEDILILREKGSAVGVVVDSIQKVVGVSLQDIQPAHPLFADIVGLDYIYGVVEKDNDLYVILDTSVILGDGEKRKEKVVQVQQDSESRNVSELSEISVSKSAEDSESRNVSELSEISVSKSAEDSESRNVPELSEISVSKSAEDSESRNVPELQLSSTTLSSSAKKEDVVEQEGVVDHSQQSLMLVQKNIDKVSLVKPKQCDVGILEKGGLDSVIPDGSKELKEVVFQEGSQECGAIKGSGDDFESLEEEIIDDSFLEHLFHYSGFCASELNQNWLRERYSQWITESSGVRKFLSDREDAFDFLKSFNSFCSIELWGEEILDEFHELTFQCPDRAVHIWVVNCGSGFSTYSIAGGLFLKGRMCKIYATDDDFSTVMGASGMVFKEDVVPRELKPAMIEGPEGWKFSNEVKNSVIFEYHNIINSHIFPHLDIIVARDVLSYVNEEVYMRFFEKLDKQVKNGALLVVGDNEVVVGREDWVQVPNNFFSVYKKEV